MKISALEEYGLRCLMQLAKANTEALSIGDIAKIEGISEAYVGKILFLLRKSGFVKSLRGIKGGYLLAKPPQEITMASVLDCLAPGPKTDAAICSKFPGAKKECVHLTGFCSIQTVWHTIYKSLWNTLSRTTLTDLLKNEQDLIAKLDTAPAPLPRENFIPVTLKMEENTKHVTA